MPKLYALADLHLSHPGNRTAWSELSPHLEDSLILPGDVGESEANLRSAFSLAIQNFKQVFWVPGNHELYTMMTDKTGPRGESKYLFCVKIAREYGVLTPEDEWALWEGDGGPAIVALCFTLYDYSFRPPDVSREAALDWARETGVEATDEHLLHYQPYESRDQWCHKLVDKFERKFEDASRKWPGVPTVIVNHWPLREDMIFIPLIPRFTLWCGTKRTQQWHRTWNARVVVSGHLHVRRTDWMDGVRFEECSLGYPRQWKDAKDCGKGVNQMMREILPGPPDMSNPNERETKWRRLG